MKPNYTDCYQRTALEKYWPDDGEMAYHNRCSVRKSFNLTDFIHTSNFPSLVHWKSLVSIFTFDIFLVWLYSLSSAYQHRQFLTHIRQVMCFTHTFFAQTYSTYAIMWEEKDGFYWQSEYSRRLNLLPQVLKIDAIHKNFC